MKYHHKPITFVELVELKVADLQRSVEFYENIIGFTILEQQANKIYLTADGKTALLSIEQPADIMPTQQKTAGLYHFALLLPTRADLGAILICYFCLLLFYISHLSLMLQIFHHLIVPLV